MIQMNEYVGVWAGHKDWTPEYQRNAFGLLIAVNNLMASYEKAGKGVEVNLKTKSQVSGETGGGFRPQDYPVGAKNSSHKTGQAVDVYDPHGELDRWIDNNPEVLIQNKLYREAPAYTIGWSHLSTKSPKSGKHTFLP